MDLGNLLILLASLSILLSDDIDMGFELRVCDRQPRKTKWGKKDPIEKRSMEAEITLYLAAGVP